ncbi:MAG: signal peptidase II [Pirellulales bacterium]
MKAVSLNRYVIFLAIAVVGCGIDLSTKSWAFERLGFPGPDNRRAIYVLDDVFTLETHLNEGALFGVGQGQTTLFAILSLAAAVGVCVWLFAAGAAEDLLLTVALGGVVGGIFGNLYDRLGWHELLWLNDGHRGHVIGERVYAVRDWMHFKIDAIGFDWPVFNIADSLLVCGAGLLVLHAFRRPST